MDPAFYRRSTACVRMPRHEYGPYSVTRPQATLTRALRRLVLADHFPPLAGPVSPILFNVEHLDISMRLGRQWDHPNFGPGFMNGPDASPYLKLFTILPHMKSLKTLVLKYCLLPPMAFNSANHQTLELPHLQRLEIDDGANECVDFLRYLRIPAAATLSIQCIIVHAPLKQTCSALVPLLRAHLNAAPAPIQALAVMTPDLHRQTAFSLTAWHAPVSFPLLSAQPASVLALQIDARQRTRDDLADVTRFLHDLPLASARTAHFMLRGELGVQERADQRAAVGAELLPTGGLPEGAQGCAGPRAEAVDADMHFGGPLDGCAARAGRGRVV